MSPQDEHQFLTAVHPAPLARSICVPGANLYELYRRVARPDRPSFLLESGGTHSLARYSFFGSDPYLILCGKNGSCELQHEGQTTRLEREPFGMLAELLRRCWRPHPPGLPPFFGGAVGLFGYDLIRRFETLPSIAVDDLASPDLTFAFVELLAA